MSADSILRGLWPPEIVLRVFDTLFLMTLMLPSFVLLRAGYETAYQSASGLMSALETIPSRYSMSLLVNYLGFMLCCTSVSLWLVPAKC